MYYISEKGKSFEQASEDLEVAVKTWDSVCFTYTTW